jgi:hypothetical protein
VIAITMPASTNTMITICIQNQWRGIGFKATGEDQQGNQGAA